MIKIYLIQYKKGEVELITEKNWRKINSSIISFRNEEYLIWIIVKNNFIGNP